MNVLLMCFLVPFAIVSGIAVPLLLADWINKVMTGPHSAPKKDRAGQ